MTIFSILLSSVFLLGLLAPSNVVDPIRLHHAWPKYLGGAFVQTFQALPKSIHDAYHSGLDKLLPRQWGKTYYDNLSAAARKQLEQDLAAYAKAFDAKYGTTLWEAMLRNGFSGL
jgi:hypothetical protein